MTALARTIVVVIVLSCGASAQAQLTPPVDAVTVVRPEAMERVQRALFVIEGDAPASFFATMGTEGRDALLTIVRDVGRPVGLRRRAVLALHHYPEPAVRIELASRAASASEDAVVSRYALRSLAAAFGAAAFDVIAGRLEDERALVREGAAIALASIDAERARAILVAHLSTEPEAFIRQTLARLIEP